MKNKYNVYALVRRCPDVKHHMVEILGIYKDRSSAMAAREKQWETHKRQTDVEQYILLDSLD